MAFANGRIAVSARLGQANDPLLSGAGRAPFPTASTGRRRPTTETLQAFGLTPNRYALTVARIDEQKRQLDLIAAYARLRRAAMEARARGRRRLFRKLRARRRRRGATNARRRHARARRPERHWPSCTAMPACSFCRPATKASRSPCSRPRALVFPLILSDIAAHRELALPRARYFAVGDIAGFGGASRSGVRGAGRGKARCHRTRPAPGPARLAAPSRERTLAVYFDALSPTGSARAPRIRRGARRERCRSRPRPNATSPSRCSRRRSLPASRRRSPR